jgi:hypothetical protein
LRTLPPVVQAALVVVALLVVMGSSLIADHATFNVIRLLEGYWPTPVARAVVARRRKRLRTLEGRWNELMAKTDEGTASDEEHAELARLEATLAAMPARPEHVMPTRLGNVLRAAEDAVEAKYGLDAVRCWSVLWLVLPEVTRNELEASRTALNTAATWWLWGALLVVWVVFTPWAILAAVVASWLAYRAVLAAGAQYASLIDAAYALHRGALYDGLGYPRPATPEAERDAGRNLTEALARGPGLAAISTG